MRTYDTIMVRLAYDVLDASANGSPEADGFDTSTCCDIIQYVNRYASSPEWYRERWLAPDIRSASIDHPVVMVTGARQVGKSTLLQHETPFRDWRYRTLDDLDTLAQAREDPEGLWAAASEVVLDEVQKAPALLNAVKSAVDREPGRRFVLSGSANLLLMQHVSESLAGRAVWFVLDPLTLGEEERRPAPNILGDLLSGKLPPESTTVPRDPVPHLLRGFMPAMLRLDAPDSWLRWWEGYVATYLERDLRQISRVDALGDYRRVMQLLALRSGQLLNQSEVARDAHVSQPTVHRYANLLETTHLLHRLPAYTTNQTTSVLKSPRVLWADPGLATYLCGLYGAEQIRASRELGGLFENLVYLHVKVLARSLTPRARLFFWRTRAGREVDLVVEHGQRLAAIEVNWTDRPSYRHTEGLRRFIESHDRAVAGLLVCRCERVQVLGDRIAAVPWTAVAGAG